MFVALPPPDGSKRAVAQDFDVPGGTQGLGIVTRQELIDRVYHAIPVIVEDVRNRNIIQQHGPVVAGAQFVD
jgi:hypothetical protein